MKSYTDIEQSKRLAEFLPLESADMVWQSIYDENHIMSDYRVEIIPYRLYSGIGIPCWSLASLFDAIPQEIFNGEYIINITEGCDNRWVLTYDHCENENHSYYGLSSGADNLVDACYELVLNLHKRKML